MTDRSLNDLCPSLQILAREFLAQCNNSPIFKVRQLTAIIDQTYRCETDQNADYAQGRTAPGNIITNAKYGQSPHNCTDANGMPAAKAFDFAIETPQGTLDWDVNDPAWQKALSVGKGLGLVSGGGFPHLRDWPHFEMAFWK